MTRDEQLAAIRQKCIEANPEPHDGSTTCHCPVRLADVLLAIGKELAWNEFGIRIEGPYAHLMKFGQEFRFPESDARWDLHAHDLDQQSDETISFIHSLLHV